MNDKKKRLDSALRENLKKRKAVARKLVKSGSDLEEEVATPKLRKTLISKSSSVKLGKPEQK